MKKMIEQYVGKVGQIVTGALIVDVNILDVKQAYGNIRYKVTPVSGSGEVWVENVKLKK